MINLKRAVLFGALLWMMIFFEVSILMFGFKLEAGTVYYIIHYILAVILALVTALVYFNGKKIKAGAKQGLLVGIIMALTGIILDAIITVPLFVKSYSFFLDTYLWIGILLGILTISLVGYLKK
ncbi:MAG: hypothetical protein ABIH72_02925 [archaeon]